MPYQIREGGEDCPFEVVKSDSGERVACHPSREKAMAHMQALYANVPDAAQRADKPDDRPKAPLEFREANVDNVDYTQRIITVIVAPYEQPATVEYRGEMWTEFFERGAFSSVQSSPQRVRANRDHNRSRTCGKVTRFWPDSESAAGLVGEIRIARTDLGDETLALADEDCLSASAGFAAWPRDQILDRSKMTRRIRKAFLDHVAFVEAPAYDGAQVLSVRDQQQYFPQRAPLRTPNLELALTEIESVFRWADARLNKQ